MPAPTTSEEFIDLVRKSGVMDEKRLDAYAEKLRTAVSLPPEPAKLAGLMVRDSVLTQFQAENFLQGRWRRFTIGNYKVLKRIATGGMGSVYLCEHKFMRRRAAVKVLPTAKASDPASLERFYREARAVAALDHPNIVRAYDVDHEDDLHFLVMEYVDGSSLQDLVRERGPLDPNRGANYISQAALGLQHAHEVAGLVHRDIKPGNMIVDRNNTLKLLDMGLARFFLDEEDHLTKKYDENVLGTADYLAPEQVVDSHEVDIRADIYSLGATFYFCLTGRTPFGEGTAAQKLIWHQTRQVKPIRTIREDVPESMAVVLEKMLAKDPSQRYQTPVEVVSALAEWAKLGSSSPADLIPDLTVDASGTDSGIIPIAKPTSPSRPLSPSVERLQPAAPQKTPPPGNQQPPRKVTVTSSGPPSPQVGKQPPKTANKPEHVAAALVDALGKGPPSGKNRSARLNRSAPGTSTAEEESISLEKSASDTQETRARADTEPSAERKKSAKRLRPAAAPRKRKDNQMLIWGLAVGGAAAVLLLAAFIIGWRTSGKKLLGGTRWYVSRQGIADANACLTIRDALRKISSGDHIVVMDEMIDEQLDLRDVKNLTIEAAPGRMVLWHYPERESRGGEPYLFRVHNVENLRINGFSLDGRGQLDQLVFITGHCPGLCLESLKLSGARKSGIVVVNGAGTRSNPVSFLDLEFKTQGLKEAGLMFKIEVKIADPKINEHFVVSDCFFDGPLETASRLERGKILEDAKFLQNKYRATPDGTAARMPGPY
jgi:serine/threonine protein kinase